MINDTLDFQPDRFVPFSDAAIHQMLVKHYESEIRQRFDFEALAATMRASIENENDSAGYELMTSESEFIGTVMSLAPSGKYWHMIAASNIDEIEAAMDSAYFEALDRVAESAGGWIESGEGDPCDLLFCWQLDPNEFRR